MLSDKLDPELDYSAFDEVLTIEDLDLPVESLEAWIFKHTVVELSTAVKPWAFKKIFQRHNAESVLYMDPDTVAYSRMEEVHEALRHSPIVLTPHVTVPAVTDEALLDGEMLGCLRHGVFNLGFLALSAHEEGQNFLDWWARRCLEWCYDDAARGLFTDQRWLDLAPCFFPSLSVLRHPGYNVATWNLYYRNVSRSESEEIMINQKYPLRFFHFSGFDLGTYEYMLKKHAPGHSLLRQMTDWYVAKQIANGQKRLGGQPGIYDVFADGERIPREWRVHYRENADLQKSFPRPYSDSGLHRRLKGQTLQQRPHISQPFYPRNRIIKLGINQLQRRPKLMRWLREHLPAGVTSRLKHLLLR